MEPPPGCCRGYQDFSGREQVEVEAEGITASPLAEGWEGRGFGRARRKAPRLSRAERGWRSPFSIAVSSCSGARALAPEVPAVCKPYPLESVQIRGPNFRPPLPLTHRL